MSTSERKRVGIVNQGNTCYLNSVIQALFNLPKFRNEIYRLKGAEDDEIATALRNIFAQLDAGVDGITTTELTAAFGWGAQDTAEQHDVHELIQQLFDSLENITKGTPQENFIRDLFCGSTVYRTNAIDGADYLSDRLEGFYDVELVVKDRDCIEDSFKEMVTPEKIDGVAIQVSPNTAPSPHNIERSQRFLRMPPVLLIHPNRVAFDLKTYELITLNNRWTFGTELDLSAYMMSDKELKLDAESQANRSKYVRPQQNMLGSKYQLRTVLIHAGDAEIGHYYSFVRFGEQWMRFNDEDVDNTEPSEVEKSAFGGGGAPIRYSRFDHERASLLVYVNTDCLEEVLTERPPPPEILKAVEQMTERRNAQSNRKSFTYYLCNKQLVDILDNVPNATDGAARTLCLPSSSSVEDVQEAIAADLNVLSERVCVWDYVTLPPFGTIRASVHKLPYLCNALVAQVLPAPRAPTEVPFLALLRFMEAVDDASEVRICNSYEELMETIPRGWSLFCCDASPARATRVCIGEAVPCGANVIACPEGISGRDVQHFLIARQYQQTSFVYLDQMNPAIHEKLFSLTTGDNVTYGALQNIVFDFFSTRAAVEAPPSADHIAFFHVDRSTGKPLKTVAPQFVPSLEDACEQTLGSFVLAHQGERELFFTILPTPLSAINESMLVTLNVGWGCCPSLYLPKGTSEMTVNQLVMMCVHQVGKRLDARVLKRLLEHPEHRTTRLLKLVQHRPVGVVDDPNTVVNLSGPYTFVLDPLSISFADYELHNIFFYSRRTGTGFFGLPTNIIISKDKRESGLELLMRLARKLRVPHPEEVVKKWVLSVQKNEATRTVGAKDCVRKAIDELGGAPYCIVVDRPLYEELDGWSYASASPRYGPSIVIKNSSNADLSSL